MDDTTYSAFLMNPDFLKTILNPSDELNSILQMIFQPDPDQRITVANLRSKIQQLPGFYSSTSSSRPSCAPITNNLSNDSGYSAASQHIASPFRSSLSSHDSAIDVDDEYPSAYNGSTRSMRSYCDTGPSPLASNNHGIPNHDYLVNNYNSPVDGPEKYGLCSGKSPLSPPASPPPNGATRFPRMP